MMITVVVLINFSNMIVVISITDIMVVATILVTVAAELYELYQYF